MLSPVKIVRGLLLAVLLAAFPASANEVLDQGAYSVYQGGRSIGSEKFFLEALGESLVLSASATQKVETRDGPRTVERDIRLVMSRLDFEMRDYTSKTQVAGDSVKRGVVPGDTVLTIYREDAVGGEGTTYPKPPGRLFVFEAGVYSLIDVALRNLSGVSFEERDVSLLVLGPRDTILDARIKRVGKESVPWGATSVVAEHFRLSDPTASFDVWMHPRGRMIRLASEDYDVRVERKPPAVKPKAKAGS